MLARPGILLPGAVLLFILPVAADAMALPSQSAHTSV